MNKKPLLFGLPSQIPLKEVPGIPGYFVSETGDIHSFHSSMHRILKPSLRNGYFHVGLMMSNGRAKMHSIHRLVAHTWCHNDSPGAKIQVHHIDHNRQNNHYTNLEWCTAQHNIKMNFVTGGKKGVKSYLGVKGPLCSFTKLIRQCHPEDGVIAVYWGLEDASKKSGRSEAAISNGLKYGKPMGSRSNKSQKYIWRHVF